MKYQPALSGGALIIETSGLGAPLTKKDFYAKNNNYVLCYYFGQRKIRERG